jgi:hypothetical protein
MICTYTFVKCAYTKSTKLMAVSTNVKYMSVHEHTCMHAYMYNVYLYEVHQIDCYLCNVEVATTVLCTL